VLTITYRIIYNNIKYLLNKLIEINKLNKYNTINKTIDNNKI
jgi:hypothetical protein